MQLVSVLAVTALSAIILHFRKKVRTICTIWDSSPYQRCHILRVPLLTIVGVVYFCHRQSLPTERTLNVSMVGKTVC